MKKTIRTKDVFSDKDTDTDEYIRPSKECIREISDRTEKFKEEIKTLYFEMLNDKKCFLKYALSHTAGTFAVELLICLLLTTRKNCVVFSGIAGSILAGTICGMLTNKTKFFRSLQANTGFFLTVGMFFYGLSTFIIAVLFDVQL